MKHAQDRLCTHWLRCMFYRWETAISFFLACSLTFLTHLKSELMFCFIVWGLKYSIRFLFHQSIIFIRRKKNMIISWLNNLHMRLMMIIIILVLFLRYVIILQVYDCHFSVSCLKLFIFSSCHTSSSEEYGCFILAWWDFDIWFLIRSISRWTRLYAWESLQSTTRKSRKSSQNIRIFRCLFTNFHNQVQSVILKYMCQTNSNLRRF